MNKRILIVYSRLSKTGAYANAVEAAALEPALVEADGPVSAADYGGVLLMGGADVNPALYGETPGPETEAPEDDRDQIEGRLIDECLERDLPLLAICRGHQLLNVHMGGTLVQHLPSVARHRRKEGNPGAPAHEVDIAPGTKLASIAGTTDRWNVTSRHHQGVARVGAGLRVSARDPEDGMVEALELPSRRFVLSVQWHPEDQVPGDAEQMKLFRAFAAAVKGEE
jgi:putative glutamine amidotransferase